MKIFLMVTKTHVQFYVHMVTNGFWSPIVWQLKPFFQLATSVIFNLWQLNFLSPLVISHNAQQKLSKNILHAPFPNSILGN
jgi:hypothetical protein